MTMQAPLIDLMLSVWNTRDADARADIVSRSLAPDLRFCDPRHDIQGHPAFLEMVEAFQSEFPDAAISRTSAIDTHHDRARYHWAISWPDGRRFEGFDAVRFHPQTGQVLRVDGFFGPLKGVKE